MNVFFVPWTQGKFALATGPVHSGKESRLASLLNSARDSKYKGQENDILIFRHPRDSKKPDLIGKHLVDLVTEDPQKIANRIGPNNRNIIIAGISHYEDSNIVDLVDSLVRSNRNVVASALNMDSKGNPYNHLPDLISHIDRIEQTMGRCKINGCGSRNANWNVEIDSRYFPACLSDYNARMNPFDKYTKAGFIGVETGSMFSGKTEAARLHQYHWEKDGHKVVVYESMHNVRYDEPPREVFEEGYTCTHDLTKKPCIKIESGKHIEEHLRKNPQYRHLVIEEGQFIKGLRDSVVRLASQGYSIVVSTLIQGFNKKKFGEGNDLIPSANYVNLNYATCEDCGHPATNSRRMKKTPHGVEVANANDPLELSGGQEIEGQENPEQKVSFFYQATCHDHWDLKGEAPLKYQFDRWTS